MHRLTSCGLADDGPDGRAPSQLRLRPWDGRTTRHVGQEVLESRRRCVTEEGGQGGVGTGGVVSSVLVLVWSRLGRSKGRGGWEDLSTPRSWRCSHGVRSQGSTGPGSTPGCRSEGRRTRGRNVLPLRPVNRGMSLGSRSGPTSTETLLHLLTLLTLGRPVQGHSAGPRNHPPTHGRTGVP